MPDLETIATLTKCDHEHGVLLTNDCLSDNDVGIPRHDAFVDDAGVDLNGEPITVWERNNSGLHLKLIGPTLHDK